MRSTGGGKGNYVCSYVSQTTKDIQGTKPQLAPSSQRLKVDFMD